MSTLFKQLHALATQSEGLVFSVIAAEDKLTVAVMPKSRDAKAAENGLLTPMVLTGTPEELDAEFVQCLSEFNGQRRTLVEQLASAKSALDAAQKKSTAKAADAGKSASATKPAAKSAIDLIDDDSGDDENGGDDEAPAVAAPSVAAQAVPAAPAQAEEMGSLFGNLVG